MAVRHGEGVSKGVRLVITKDGQLQSATIGGQPVDTTRNYRIATLDYLAQGNDGLTAFKAKTNVVSPQEEQYDIRYIIVNYFRQNFAQQHKAADAQVEGRITIK